MYTVLFVYISVQLFMLYFSVLTIAMFVTRDRTVKKKSQSVLKSSSLHIKASSY